MTEFLSKGLLPSSIIHVGSTSPGVLVGFALFKSRSLMIISEILWSASYSQPSVVVRTVRGVDNTFSGLEG